MANMPIKAPLKHVPAAHHSGRRDMATVRVICLHSTEGSTAAGAAYWFRNPASGGSAHIAVDASEGYRCLNDDFKPWANGWNQTLDLEQAGFARWPRAQWLTPSGRRQLRRGAYRVALWCWKYDIRPYWLTPVDVRQGKSGVTSHRNISAAFHQSDHSDPGLGYPRRLFMRHVRRYLAALRAA